MTPAVRARCLGITLIEILIAAAILALAVVPMIGVFSTTGQSLLQTLPYYQSVFLGEKAAEQARLGSFEDPYYLERLLSQGFGAARGPIVRGGHPCFDVLEDSKEPFGRIQPGIDWAVVPEAGSLFSQVEPLALALTASQGPGVVSTLPEARLAISFDWLDARGKEMKYLLHTPLLIWTTAEIRRLEDPQAQVATDQVLGSALLPGGGKGLARIAAERGASVAMLGDFARLLHLGSIGKAITDQTTRDVAVLEQQEQAASNLPLKVIARNRIARVQEDAAARLLVLLQQLRPSVESMAMNVTTQALGNPLPPREQRRDAVVLVGNTHDSMFIQMRGALSRAMEVGQENRLCAGERVKAYQRVLRIAKLESLAGPWPNRNREALRTYIRGLSEFYKHRIPNLEHFFNVEDERLDSPETRYPLYPATQDVCKLRESFAQLCIRLLLLGSEATS